MMLTFMIKLEVNVIINCCIPHSAKPKMKCILCDKSFCCFYTMKRLIFTACKLSANKYPTIPCCDCKESFTRYDSSYRHIRTTFPNKALYYVQHKVMEEDENILSIK